MVEKTCAQKLAEARAAYHDLVTGAAIKSFVDQNGERVEYTMANRSALNDYINALDRECGAGAGAAPVYRGPLRFTYGPKRFF